MRFLCTLCLCFSVLLPLFSSSILIGAEKGVISSKAESRLALDTPNREWFVVVSDGNSDIMRNKTRYQMYDFLGDAAVNDVVHLIEAKPEHHHRSTGVVPDKPKLTRLRSRELQDLSAAISDLLKVRNREIYETDNKQLDLFRLGTTIAQLRQTDFPVCVVCVGTPLFHDPSRHGGLSMLAGKVPTLATLREGPLSHMSVFFQGVTKFPPFTQIAILTEQKWGVDSIHEAEVSKYLRTFAWLNGKAMVQSITDSPVAAFDLRRPQPVEVGTKFYELLPGFDVEDYPSEFGIRRATVDSIQQDDAELGPRVVIFGGTTAKPPALDGSPADVEEIIQACFESTEKTALCMRWKPDQDITDRTDNDWYLVHPEHDEVVSYQNKKAPFAHLHNDMLVGATTADGGFASNWEVVTVENEALANAEFEVWINTYRGRGSIPCNIVFVGNGKRTSVTLNLPNQDGDRGKQFGNREEHSSWLRVPLPRSLQSQAAGNEVSESNSISSENARTLLQDVLAHTIYVVVAINNAWKKLSTASLSAPKPAAQAVTKERSIVIKRAKRKQSTPAVSETAEVAATMSQPTISLNKFSAPAVAAKVPLLNVPQSPAYSEPANEDIETLTPLPSAEADVIEVWDECVCYPTY